MEFNINEDGMWGMLGVDEEVYLNFRTQLHQLFLASPEGQSIEDLLEIDEDTEEKYAPWTELFLDMYFGEIKRSFFFITANDVREVLYDIFPHSVIIDVDEIPQLIRELQAFFGFIDREFDLYSSASCLKVFSQKGLVARLTKEFSDESKFGPIKTIILQAQAEGVDVEDEAELEKFFTAYNMRMQAEYEAIMNTPISDKAQAKIKEIRKLVKDICTKHLDQEYAEVSENMLEELATLRPCPFEDKSQAKSWAAGIVWAVGRVNFLGDRSSEPYMTMADLAKLFNVGQESASKKAHLIMQDLDIIIFDPRWTVPSRQADNPLPGIMNNMFQALGLSDNIIEFFDGEDDDTPLLFIPPGTDIPQ